MIIEKPIDSVYMKLETKDVFLLMFIATCTGHYILGQVFLLVLIAMWWVTYSKMANLKYSDKGKKPDEPKS